MQTRLIQVRPIYKWLSFLGVFTVGLSFNMAVSAQGMSDFESYPVNIANKKDPLVMLGMSLDHQLFYKAYTDYDDLYDDPNTTADDGIPENTYHPEVDYIGYFDHAKCYDYNKTKKYFEPTGLAASGGGVSNAQYCSNAWSGNFLNWVSMTRMDVVRKVLYGGKRSTEWRQETVLERAHLPNDAHSFAKYYAGSDLNKLVPNNVSAGIKTNFSCGAKPTSVSSDAVWDSYIGCMQGQGITFCNTTLDRTANIFSQQSTANPLIRAIEGNYSLWAANERYQCLYGVNSTSEVAHINNEPGSEDTGYNFSDPRVNGFYAYNRNPEKPSDGIADYVARVRACKPGIDEGEENCKTYTNHLGQDAIRPIGLLQEFGGKDSDGMAFGLITGSYKYNKSFGKLRSNIGDISDEIQPWDGKIRSTVPGLINTINAFRIANYGFDYTGALPPGTSVNWFHGTYNLPSADGCWWGMTSFNDGQCTGWGNPFSEILFEGYRYLSGATAPYVNQPLSDASLGGTLANIPDNITWDTTITDLECKSLNLVGFNASSVSYDGDIAGVNLASAGIGSESITVAEATNVLTPMEIVAGTKYFVGEVNGASVPNAIEKQQCTAKTVTNLADVRGTCPDSPRLGGSYLAAGIAHHAQSKGVRSSSGGAGVPIKTFGVNLAPALPKLNVPVPGREAPIVLQPACRSLGADGSTFKGNCAIVDFKIVEPHSEVSGKGEGSFLVVWEDSEQGGDYDMDLSGMVQYEVTNTQLILRSTVLKDSTGDALGFGYIVSGLGNGDDGFYTPASTTDRATGDRDYIAPAPYGCPHNKPGASGSVCVYDGDVSVHTLPVSSGATGQDVAFLESPLYYAAKWGNLDTKGNPRISDGRPETYYDVRNTSQLQTEMRSLFTDLNKSENAASASGVAVNDTNFNRMIVQTVFYPVYRVGNEEVNWVGGMHSMLVTREPDSSGDERVFLVEDTNQNGLLDTSDKRIDSVVFDENNGQTYAEFVDGSSVEISEVKALWNAQSSLNAVVNYTTQRSWGAKASTARYVVGAVDKNGDGQITSTESMPFVDDLFSGNTSVTEGLGKDNYRFLDVPSGLAADAQDVVKFIRGDESISGFRSRTIGSNSWLLGDIVHSAPIIVGSPTGNFYDVHGDTDYLDFYQAYYNRRNVTYVGANDGMLHAFNAGFPSTQRQGFDLTHDNGSLGDATDDPVDHTLGAELWSYVPFNLLPHLKWLTDESYSHVAYVDSTPQTFDVKIFDESSDSRHVGDWGTILVVGMRLGGGEYEIDPDGAGTKPSQTLRSAYVILDVTDPEQAPRLLGEITHPDLAFTTGDADIVYRNGRWSLVFGSGPNGTDALLEATSDQNAKLFSLDLNDLVAGTVDLSVIDTGIDDAFVGGVRSVDWDRDLNSDALYFGLVGGVDGAGNPQKGRLMRALVLDSGITGVSQLLSGVDAAFSETPVTVTDGQKNYWVYAGAGRFYVDEDDKNSGQLEAYYGVKESSSILSGLPSAVALTSLMDVSNIQTNLDGDLYVGGIKGNVSVVNKAGAALVDDDGNAVSAANHTELARYMTQREVQSGGTSSESPIRGWVKTYRNTGELTVTKTVVDPVLFSLVFNTYTPTVSTSSCPLPGDARSYSLDLRTGLFNGYYANLNIDPTNPTDRQKPLTEQDTKTSNTKLNDPVALIDLGVKFNDNTEAENNPGGTVDITVDPGRRTWQEIPMDTFYNW